MTIQASALPPNTKYSPHGKDLVGRLPGLLGVFDWVAVVLCGFLAGRVNVIGGWGMPIQPASVLLVATLTVNYLYLAQAYGVRSVAHAAAQFVKVPIALLASVLTVCWINWLSGFSDEPIDGTTELWYGSALLVLLGMRWAVQWQLARWRLQGRLLRRVAVLGSDKAAVRLGLRLGTATDATLVGVFLEGGLPGDPAIAGNTDHLVVLAGMGEVDEVIFASPWESPAALATAITKFSPLQTEIKIDPQLTGLNVIPRAFGFVADVPLLTVQLRPLPGWGAPLKRAEDLLFSSLLLVACAPFLLVIALLIRLDTRGPMLFRQERWGFNGNRIVVYKFRSMHHESHADVAVPQARRNDPRVTRVGAFLRRTSLDELPQLINVLEGTMSLVGPRPHAAAHNEKYAKLIDGYIARHRMKPGITGWAQINGARGETENPKRMARRVELDLSYIANWSLLLDLKVLVLTLPVVLRGDNAY
jgi:putative colanic acid biosynthesis UDP-glucose lipid carrier transferase